MLLKTRVELELITDMKMLKLFEDMKRGGLCFVGSKRTVKANNKYIEGYDQNKESGFIMYWGCNSLYGKNMSEYLPFADQVLQRIAGRDCGDT